MKHRIRHTALLFLLLCSETLSAQSVEMADAMRADGKIYVVVTIILIILLGFIGYLFVQDRKLSRLEKFFDGKKQTK
jgi:hypothetical protein